MSQPEQGATFAKDLSILYISMLFTRIGFGSIIVIFPRYVEAGFIATGVVLAIYPILEAVSAAPIGIYIDRRGRKRMLVLGLLSIGILSIIIGLTRNVLSIAIAHGLMGFSAAAVTVSSLTMITDFTRVSNRGAGMGVFDFSNLAGYAVGILLGSQLFEYFAQNPGYSFFVTSALLFFSGLTSLTLLREPLHQEAPTRLELNPISGLDPKTKAMLPLWFALTAMLGIVFFLPKALGEAGFTSGQTGFTLFAGAAGVGLGAVGFGRLSDKIGREKVAAIGVLGMLGLLPSLTVSLSPDLNPEYPNFGRYLFLIAPFALLTSALVPSILALVGDTVKAHLRGSAMGLYSMMLSIGIALGNILGGFASELGGVVGVLNAGTAVFVSSLTLTLILRLRLRSHRAIIPEEKAET